MFARTGVVTAFSVIVALLGLASAAMHATGTELRGSLDFLSLHLVAAFVAAYAAARSTGGRHFLAWLVGFVLAAQSAALVPGQVPLLRHPENVTFVLLLLIVVWLEALHPASRGPVRDTRWIAAAVTTLVGPSECGTSLRVRGATPTPGCKAMVPGTFCARCRAGCSPATTPARRRPTTLQDPSSELASHAPD